MRDRIRDDRATRHEPEVQAADTTAGATRAATCSPADVLRSGSRRDSRHRRSTAYSLVKRGELAALRVGGGSLLHGGDRSPARRRPGRLTSATHLLNASTAGDRRNGAASRDRLPHRERRLLEQFVDCPDRANASLRWRDRMKPAEDFGGLTIGLGHEVRVDVEGRRRVSMAETALSARSSGFRPTNRYQDNRSARRRGDSRRLADCPPSVQSAFRTLCQECGERESVQRHGREPMGATRWSGPWMWWLARRHPTQRATVANQVGRDESSLARSRARAAGPGRRSLLPLLGLSLSPAGRAGGCRWRG